MYVRESRDLARKVSVVVCTLNAPEFVAGINSLLQHTAVGYELIIVADTPDEKRRSQLNTLEHQYGAKVIVNQARQGVPKAMNMGIAASTRQYVMLLNDDVEVRTPDWLTSLVQALDKHPELGMVSPRCTYRDRDEAGYYAAVGEASLMTRAMLDKVGKFDEDEAYRHLGTDGDYYMRLTRAGYTPRGIDSVVVYHHVGKTIVGDLLGKPALEMACMKKLEAVYGDAIKVDQHRFPAYSDVAPVPVPIQPPAPVRPFVAHMSGDATQPGQLLFKRGSSPTVLPPSGTSTLPVQRGPNDPLHIALFASALIPVPPVGYGGLERIVYDLAVALAQKGQKVTLFAPDGSHAEGCEVVTFGPAAMTPNCNWLEAERVRYQKMRERLNNGFDVIHSHDWFGFGFGMRKANPALRICHTHHGGMDMRWWGTKAPFPTNIFGISEWMARVYANQGVSARPVHNGVSLAKYRFQPNKGDRLAFVGRASTFKQPHVAVEVAKRLGMPIDLVCGTFVDSDEYMRNLKAMCDGKQVCWVEDPPQDEKVRIMQNARCVLFPSHMGEPFGLVPAEAMACGTPVVALDDGAVREVVEDGKTGYVVSGAYTSDNRISEETLTALCESVKRVGAISPQACRERVERLFSREVMADNYMKAYRDILAGREW